MRCPRRDEGSVHPAFAHKDDTWREIPDEPDPRCSFCGSLHPDAFMRRIEAGEQVEPTDKNYKAYLERPWAKFYFPHLDEDQKRRFVELLNAGKLTIAYPGHFYVLPFFVATRT